MGDFRDLRVWQDSIKLCKSIYQTTSSFPKNEEFGLTSQMRRAAVSIASNIAEGSGRQHKKEFIHFIYLARGSLYELITQIELARETTLLNAAVCKELLGSCEILARDLNALISSLKSTLPGTKN